MLKIVSLVLVFSDAKNCQRIYFEIFITMRSLVKNRKN